MMHIGDSRDRFCCCLRYGVAFAAAASALLLIAPEASAQIKQPGAHAKYSVELEPHFSLWWENHGYWTSNSGWGAGLRASIPLVHNGFVPSINNNVAIGFGFDWGHFEHRCYPYHAPANDPRYYGDCSTNQFLFPVVMQWNFFITKIFSVFVEPGLGINHARWNWSDGWCWSPSHGYYVCDDHDSKTYLDPVFAVGGRVGTEKVSFTFRLGWPYASLGASFFL